MFHMNIKDLAGAWIHDISTSTPFNSPNTDSLHLTRTTDVLVEDYSSHGASAVWRAAEWRVCQLQVHIFFFAFLLPPFCSLHQHWQSGNARQPDVCGNRVFIPSPFFFHPSPSSH
ncbi:unnamed protein product [Closterium sp. NIES-65]|nr:unnamed protein product [Closterium sp. NIES-65]